jgi:PEP-CTERM motif-containing protein
MKDLSIAVALTASLAMATISQAHASVYDFQFTSPEVIATGQLVVDPTTQEVTAINGWVSISGQPNDMITTILADPSFPGASSNGPFTYDNIFYGGNPVFDNDGILFATAGNPGGSWNLWGNGPDNYSLYESVPNVGYAIEATGTFGVSASDAPNFAAAAPEPSTWALMLTGFAGLAYAGFRHRQKESLSRLMA